MRLARVLVVVVAMTACHDNREDYPVIPGSGGGIGSESGDVDAAVDAIGDGGALIVGRVCLVVDLRRLSECLVVGAGGLTVTLGNQAAITDATGAFAIPLPPLGSNPAWRVSGVGIRRSVVPFGGSTLLPVIDDVTYTNLVLANSALLSAGQGSIVARIVRANTPLPGATVEATPLPPSPTLYDGPDPVVWDIDATGVSGIAWIPATEIGVTVVTVTPPIGAVAVAALGVEEEAITFAAINVP